MYQNTSVFFASGDKVKVEQLFDAVQQYHNSRSEASGDVAASPSAGAFGSLPVSRVNGGIRVNLSVLLGVLQLLVLRTLLLVPSNTVCC